MKIIQKKFQGTIPENKILDTYSESQTDTYSCNMVNELVGSGGSGEISIDGDITTNNNTRLKDKNYNVIAVSHRGYNPIAPENTLPAFILSKEKGFNYVECDVSFTSDGVAVLLHDETIDRTSNGSGRVSNLTYNQLLQYDFGSWKSSEYAGTKIPTFEEFIVLCKNIGLHPNIELKDNGNYTQEQILEIVDIVKNCGMKGNVTYVSFNINYLNYVKAYDKQARLGYVMFDITQDKINEALNLKSGLNDVFITASYTNLTDAKIQMCIDNSIPLEMWSVNDADVIKNMNSYISGVTSDSLIASQILSSNYGINSEETDPTVPQHVKNITLEDIEKWNSGTGGSGGSSYEPNIMTIVNRGKQTLKKEEYNKVIFNDILSSVGDKLELVDGGIKIGAGVKKIKLSGYSTIVTTDGYGMCHLRLMKNEFSNDNSICWLIGNTYNSWGQVVLTYPSSIVEVNEGDIICMYIYTVSTGQIGADNNVPTSNITVEVVE